MLRVVKTENGMVKGLPAADPRITAFKGVPFAAPPVGENRWRAPQKCEDWEGVREAYEFAPISVQDTPGLGTDIYCREWHVDPEIPMDEDCLYLNVWTPAKTGDEKLPVLVWFFGGAFQWGYTAEMEFDGERLARRGVVVVSVNYRLGVFGFMAHPELTAQQPDAPANFGCLDQQAGLKWVVRNIAAFGGDPDNISLAGQSAGGASVMTQITCEENYGDVKSAAIFSGLIRNPYIEDIFFIPQSLKEAEKKGESFLEFLGVSSIAEARKIDAFTLRDQYTAYAQDHIRMGICIDGKFCVDEPLTRLANNECANIPILSGNTGDEFVMTISAENEEAFKKEAEKLFGERAEEFLALPKAQIKTDMGYAPVGAIEGTIKGAFEMRCASGNKQNQFYYRFVPDIPGEDNPGTFHSVDLWFFFETLAKCSRPFVGRHYDLSRQMCDYWVNFIRTGDPNGCGSDGEMLPEWKAYEQDEKNAMEFTADGAKSCVDDDAYTEFFARVNRDKWKRNNN